MLEVEKNFAYAEGFVENYLKLQKSPVQVLEQLRTLTEGVQYYRDKVSQAEEDLNKLQTLYNSLTAQSAQYLEFMRQQKETIDQHLIDTQRDLHDENNLERRREEVSSRTNAG
jgi:chromosome segregation ATPase